MQIQIASGVQMCARCVGSGFMTFCRAVKREGCCHKAERGSPEVLEGQRSQRQSGLAVQLLRVSHIVNTKI